MISFLLNVAFPLLGIFVTLDWASLRIRGKGII